MGEAVLISIVEAEAPNLELRITYVQATKEYAWAVVDVRTVATRQGGITVKDTDLQIIAGGLVPDLETALRAAAPALRNVLKTRGI